MVRWYSVGSLLPVTPQWQYTTSTSTFGLSAFTADVARASSSSSGQERMIGATPGISTNLGFGSYAVYALIVATPGRVGVAAWPTGQNTDVNDSKPNVTPFRVKVAGASASASV